MMIGGGDERVCIDIRRVYWTQRGDFNVDSELFVLATPGHDLLKGAGIRRSWFALRRPGCRLVAAFRLHITFVLVLTNARPLCPLVPSLSIPYSILYHKDQTRSRCTAYVKLTRSRLHTLTPSLCVRLLVKRMPKGGLKTCHTTICE